MGISKYEFADNDLLHTLAFGCKIYVLTYYYIKGRNLSHVTHYVVM